MLPAWAPVAAGCLVTAGLSATLWASAHLHSDPVLREVALFAHLGCLVLGFGGVLALDWLGLLWLLFHRTRWGTLVRAATLDREMVAALGVDQRLLFTSVFALGAGLAGLGGALSLPNGSANLGIDLSVITDAFVVVVVGGLGSLPGAFVASLLIGILQAFGIVLVPTIGSQRNTLRYNHIGQFGLCCSPSHLQQFPGHRQPERTRHVLLRRRCGAPGEIRTHGLRFRKPSLYPAELRGHGRFS